MEIFKYNHDKICITFDGEAKISIGKHYKHGGKIFDFKLGGEKSSQRGFLLHWWGNVSASSLLGGVNNFGLKLLLSKT